MKRLVTLGDIAECGGVMLVTGLVLPSHPMRQVGLSILVYCVMTCLVDYLKRKKAPPPTP